MTPQPQCSSDSVFTSQCLTTSSPKISHRPNEGHLRVSTVQARFTPMQLNRFAVVKYVKGVQFCADVQDLNNLLVFASACQFVPAVYEFPLWPSAVNQKNETVTYDAN